MFIVLGLIIVLFLFILYFNFRLDWLNVIDNLVSEISGIVVTVYFVERLITGVEKRRRKDIEIAANFEVDRFVALSLQELLDIYGLQDKLKIEGRFSNDKRIELSQRIDLKLDSELFDTDHTNPENIYIKQFKAGLKKQDFSNLGTHIENGNYILNVFKDNLEPEVISYLFSCIGELKTISSTHPKLIARIDIMNNNPTFGKLQREAFQNSTAVTFCDSFSRSITYLNKLHELVNA